MTKSKSSFARHVSLYRDVVYAKFSLELAGVVSALIPVAEGYDRHKQQLPRSAYHKGLVAGLSYDSTDPSYPECPYDKTCRSNFARGENDPSEAWRQG